MANDALGDNLIRLPFYLALREAFPKGICHIAVVQIASVSALFRKYGIFDEIIEDEHLFARHPFFWIFTEGKLFCRVLRWSFFNKVEIFCSLPRMRTGGADFVEWLSCPEVSIAYSYKDTALMFPMTAQFQLRHCDKRYTHLMESCPDVHQLDDLTAMYRLVTGRRNPLVLDKTRAFLKSCFWAHENTTSGGRYVVLVPGAGSVKRQWPSSRFAELARRLGGNFVVVGTATEARLGEEIAASVQDDAHVENLCGKTPLHALSSILAHASLVVSNETGTANFAAIMGVPTLCILGGGDFGAFFPNPYCANTRAIYHREPCFFCRWRCSKKASPDEPAPCVSSITVNEVFEMAVKMQE